MDRVASVGIARVVEVDDEELRLYRILFDIEKKFVVDDLRKVRELVVIDEHRVSLLYHLLDERVVYGERLSGSRCSQNHCRSERIHHVYPSIVDLVLVLEFGWDVDGIIGLYDVLALLESLVYVVQILPS